MIRLLCIFCILLATAAHATPPCGRHDDQVGSLDREFGESVQMEGLNADGMLIETFANLETGSWTILVTRPDGLSCLVFAGVTYLSVKPGEPA